MSKFLKYLLIFVAGFLMGLLVASNQSNQFLDNVCGLLSAIHGLVKAIAGILSNGQGNSDVIMGAIEITLLVIASYFLITGIIKLNRQGKGSKTF
ncbi:MAG TPA: hypothetical protein VH186_16080 [Chloroflexia bacterium]|nr:hypothetical protein [Chloroflexia bacterium]